MAHPEDTEGLCSPISSQEAEAGRADFITEHVELQASLALLLGCAAHLDLPRRGLVHDPPLLDLARVVVGPLQGQQDVLKSVLWKERYREEG